MQATPPQTWNVLTSNELWFAFCQEVLTGRYESDERAIRSTAALLLGVRYLAIDLELVNEEKEQICITQSSQGIESPLNPGRFMGQMSFGKPVA